MAEKSYVTYAKEHGLNDTKKAEDLFNKAEQSVSKQTGKEIASFNDSNWQYVMGVFKKMISNINEEAQADAFLLTKPTVIEGIRLGTGTKIKLLERATNSVAPEFVQKIVSLLERDLKISIGLFPFPFEDSQGRDCYKAILGSDNFPITLNFKGTTLVSIGKIYNVTDETIEQEVTFKNQFISDVLPELEAILERYLFDGYFAYPEEYQDDLDESHSKKLMKSLQEESDVFYAYNLSEIERLIQKNILRPKNMYMEELYKVSSTVKKEVEKLYNASINNIVIYKVIDTDSTDLLGFIDCILPPDGGHLDFYVRPFEYYKSSLLISWNIDQDKIEKKDVFAVNTLYESLKEEHKNKLQEQGRKSSEAFIQWIDDTPDAKDLLVNERISYVYANEFLPWAEENHTTLSNVSFYQKAVSWLKSKRLENKFSKKTVIISTNNKIELVDNPKEDTEWEKMLDESPDVIYEAMEKAIHGVVSGVFNAIFIYGTSDIGKTHNVTATLDNEKATYEHVRGGFKDLKSFVRFLYENREDKILVFDDTALLKQKGFREILLAALEDKYDRVISYFDSKEMAKTRNAVPSQFHFTSGVIFISNESKVDTAIKNRCMSIPMIFNVEQILDIISKKLDVFLPKVDMSIKVTVMEFLLENVKEITRVGFRTFSHAVGYYIMYNGSRGWKKIVLSELQK